MGNYHPILMQIGTQTKKNMLSLKITISEMHVDQVSRLPPPPYVGNSSECYKMGNYNPNLMKIGIQTN
jgi:hypothetical protein